MGATIREIAREARVSTATVSRVFNTPEQVRENTKERVLDVAKRHHFVTDGLARGLVSRRSRLLGVIIPTIANSIFASSTQAVQEAAQQAGYAVIVGISEWSAEREAKLIHKFMEQRVEGIILTGAERDENVYTTIKFNKLPFVITYKLVRSPGFPCVSYDNHKASALAVDHLVSLGHKRIALIYGRPEVTDRARARREGFEQRLADYGLRLGPDMVVSCDLDLLEGRAAMYRLLRRPDPPLAVYCANDVLAIGAMHECQQQGLNIPTDISIVGCDDFVFAQYVSPQLTTVRIPAVEMGRRAVRELLNAIDGKDIGFGIELPVELIVRGSTAPPHNQS